MKKLIIRLKKVDKTTEMVKNKNGDTTPKTKIHNTLSVVFTTEAEKIDHLNMHSGNIKSFQVNNMK